MFKIAIIGPESTGKTQLARELARYFRVPWVPEYAREYIEGLPNPYDYDDVCKIARHQVKQEKATFDNLMIPLIFFDTELIITKVWFEYRYQKVPEFVTDQLEKNFFDLYLLCSPDLSWEPDPVREHGDDRDFFFNWYRKEIEHLKKPYVIIRGNGKSRTELAIMEVNQFLMRK